LYRGKVIIGSSLEFSHFDISVICDELFDGKKHKEDQYFFVLGYVVNYDNFKNGIDDFIDKGGFILDEREGWSVIPLSSENEAIHHTMFLDMDDSFKIFEYFSDSESVILLKRK